MFTRSLALVVIFSLLNVPYSYAARFPFELAGKFDDDVIRLEVRERFSLRNAVALNARGVFDNVRFFLGVDDAESAQSDRYPKKLNSPHPKFVHWFNIRGQEFPDYPINQTALMMQWLYPSPAGYQLATNQGRDFDPVKVFTPVTIGRILDSLNGFNVNNQASWSPFKAGLVDSIESTLPSRQRQSTQRRRGLTVSFVDSLVEALKEQDDRESSGNLGLYPRALVENALFNFALEKAVAGGNVVEQMREFYNAMPSIVVENWQPLNPFDNDGYKALIARIKSGDFDLNPREQFHLLCGLSAYARLFPEPIYYSTTTYNGSTFPNCGEASLLNILNGFLWDFGEKRLRPELLEKIQSENAELRNYFKTYTSVEAQQTPEGSQAWTKLLAGLKGRDITYKKGGVCEITGATSSMAGVVRALLNDQRFNEIDKLEDISSLERAKLTFDHLVEVFSIDGEAWSWEVSDAEEGEEQDLKANAGFTLNFSKEGNNTLVIDDEVYEDEIMTWEFKLGHYEAAFAEGAAAKFLAPWVQRALESDIAENRTLGLNPMRRWALTKYWAWDDIFIEKLGLIVVDEEIREDHPQFNITPLMNTEYFTQFLSEGLISYNYRNHTNRFLAFFCLTKTATAESYLFASNLFAGMPRGGIDTLKAMMSLLVDEQGKIKDQAEVQRVHPRLLKDREVALEELKNPTRAYELLESGTSVGEFIFLLDRIPAGWLDKVQTLKLFDSMVTELDYTPELWDRVFQKFGKVFENAEGQIDPSQFMTYKSSKSAESFVFKLFGRSDIKVLQWFLDRNYITRELVLMEDDKGDSHVKAFVGSWYRVPRLMLLCDHFGITKKDLREAYEMIFVHLFREASGENEDYQQVIDRLGLDKSDFLCRVTNEDEDKPDLLAGALFMIYSYEPDRIEFLFRSLGIQREDIVEAGKDFVAIEESQTTWDVYFLDHFPDLFQE